MREFSDGGGSGKPGSRTENKVLYDDFVDMLVVASPRCVKRQPVSRANELRVSSSKRPLGEFIRKSKKDLPTLEMGLRGELTIHSGFVSSALWWLCISIPCRS